MVGLEVSRSLRVFVDDFAEIRSDHNVAVVTDEERLNIAIDLTAAIRATGAMAVLLVMPKTDKHGSEPPRMVTEALKSADIGFVLTTHSITHTEANREVLESGTRMSMLRGITEDMFTEGPPLENFEEVDQLSGRLRDLLNESKSVHVTSEKGTDIEFDITNRPAFAIGIKLNDMSDVVDFPAGETAVSPKEGSANGKIVIDHALDNIGLIETPIEIEFEEGRVTKISGGLEADELMDLIENSDDNATNLAEFAIGTLRGARLTENVKEAKKRLGTVHFAIGDNKTLKGSINSDLHIDGVILNPTVKVDGRLIVERGEIIV